MTWMQMNMSDYSISQTKIQVKEQLIGRNDLDANEHE
jgi:hypothetical protein